MSRRIVRFENQVAPADNRLLASARSALLPLVPVIFPIDRIGQIPDAKLLALLQPIYRGELPGQSRVRQDTHAQVVDRYAIFAEEPTRLAVVAAWIQARVSAPAADEHLKQ